MLAARILTALCLGMVCLLVVFVDESMAPWYPMWFLLSLAISGQTAREIAGLLDRTSARPSGNSVLGGVLALVVANWVPHVIEVLNNPPDATGTLPRYDPLLPAVVFAWPLWTFVAVLMYTFVAQGIQFEKPGQTMARIAGTLLAVAYVGLLGSFVIQFRWLGQPYQAMVALFMLVAAAKGADTGAYTMGRIAGRHKLWPRLSPNKTVEGALGGMLFAVVLVLAVWYGAHRILGPGGLSAGEAVLFGLVVGAVAQLGDLMESMIKRDCSQKDASDALPGFGGMLDVMDSLLFAAPVAYGLWLLLVD
jgi:phosphatidate cytidylyltransferase